ncbi:MBL fold metallo-hydrolase [Croceibacterium ferulae]|uniref:MBL fold metallo-hydrolase n=1 Tax=Croceibacterium ferulae TaxID=1854641 RepID=UPI00240D466C|nr:MBL fold metallo-hydrolase [Croceibacterium ferulae]
MNETLPPLRAAIIPVTPLQQNCSLAWCTKTMRGALIDPGGDLDRIKDAVRRAGVTVEKILLTHGHIDHCGLAGELAKEIAVPIEGPEEQDRFWIAKLEEDGQTFGTPGRVFEPDRWLEEGDTVSFGEITMDVLHCPGHTPGHVVFIHRPTRFAFVGDVLFAGSVGRTDFPLSDHQALIDAIVTKLWPLGDMTFVPGHGPVSTFAQERASNPFVGDAALARG